MVQTVSRVLQVDPVRGQDPPQGAAPGTPAGTFRTLTAALRQASGNTLIRLAPGTYSQDNGESFPLVVPEAAVISGDETNQGRTVIIRGGGSFRGSQLGDRNVALILQGDAQVRGVTITNPQGIGIGIETGRPLVRVSQILQCSQDGIVATGTAMPSILDCQLEGMGSHGIVFAQRAKGEVQRCGLRRCSYGMAIQDEAAPLVSESQCVNNRVGISISRSARPVLRRNQMAQNQMVGLMVQQTAWPDLGQPQDPGGNVIRYNTEADVLNETSRALLSVGNDVLPQRLRGSVSLGASQVPEAGAVPPVLIGTAQVGQPAPVTPPAPGGAVLQPPVSGGAPSRFRDMVGHWAAAYVEALAERGLVRGVEDGSFQPNRAVTRAEFAALVVSSFSAIPEARPAVQFVDVGAGFWAQGAIAKAQRQGFISGFPDQTFRPNESITRIQGIVAIANGLGLPAGPSSSLVVYRDRAQIPTYAVSATAAATQHRFILNFPDPNQLRPLAPLTRAEVATLVYQGLVYQNKAPVIESGFIPRPSDTAPGFTDLANHWARPFVEVLAQNQLISGLETGEFAPNAPMTRAQYAALLTRAFQPQPKQPATSFVDVPPNFWAAEAIQSAYRAGFLSGFPDRTFAPDHPLLRVQAWVSLVNGLSLLAGQPGNSALLTRFVDSATIPDYAREAVAKAAQLGLVVNAPDLRQLRPNQVASRADIAAVVHQALVAQQRLPALTNQYIVKV
jgi:hypothetical protein